ncbi:MAG: rhomboid family intramembrane serine protease [Kiritimatiellae bacterium]|nr:rhomboid family intramembrane serine protease [Kiritimatiellia bacterium]
MRRSWYGNSPRFPYGSWLTPGVKALALVTGAVFLFQVLLALTGREQIAGIFGLSIEGLRYGRIWQLFTYMFLHAGPLHILFNGLFLIFLGPDVERVMGRKRFTVFYLACGALAGAAWVTWEFLLPTRVAGGVPTVCVGASGAVFGVLGAFAAFYPNRVMTLYLFFIIPITMKAKTMAVGAALLSVFLLIFTQGRTVADAAHLGGIIVGYLYASGLIRAGFMSPYQRPEPSGWRETFARTLRGRKLRVLRPEGPEGPSEQEIDSILEKISSQGINSLTWKERRMLKTASEALQDDSDTRPD